MKTPPLFGPWQKVLAIATLTLMVGCTTRGYPTHGGGKRFFQEQALIAGTIDRALNAIDFSQLSDLVPSDSSTQTKPISVHVFSVAHSGGGISNGSSGAFGGVLGGLFGGGFGGGSRINHNGAAAQALAAPLSGVQGNGYLSYAFGSADDIRYVMGRLIGKLGQEGLSVQTADTPDPTKPTLCILIRQLGIGQSDFNALVYSEKVLRARSSIEAFVVHTPEGAGTIVTPLGEGTSTMRFREDFFFGIGPLSGGRPEVDDTEDGQ